MAAQLGELGTLIVNCNQGGVPNFLRLLWLTLYLFQVALTVDAAEPRPTPGADAVQDPCRRSPKLLDILAMSTRGTVQRLKYTTVVLDRCAQASERRGGEEPVDVVFAHRPMLHFCDREVVQYPRDDALCFPSAAVACVLPALSRRPTSVRPVWGCTMKL